MTWDQVVAWGHQWRWTFDLVWQLCVLLELIEIANLLRKRKG